MKLEANKTVSSGLQFVIRQATELFTLDGFGEILET
jgi:hypothetical protein